MILIRKFFPLDKNYLLEQAQLHSKNMLLTELVQMAGSAYEERHNPLGLEDDLIRKIRIFDAGAINNLDEIYSLLCGIYRFRHGSNQLELLWDGSDHLTNYSEAWELTFRKWIKNLCRDMLFVQAVLDVTSLLPRGQQPAMAEARMQHFIRSHFALKIHRTKGIVAA